MDAVSVEVLGLLCEDYFELWELEVQASAQREVLRAIIKALLDSGLVEWFCRRDDGAVAVPVGGAQPPPDLLSEEAWMPVALTDPRVLLGATANGIKTYYEK